MTHTATSRLFHQPVLLRRTVECYGNVAKRASAIIDRIDALAAKFGGLRITPQSSDRGS